MARAGPTWSAIPTSSPYQEAVTRLALAEKGIDAGLQERDAPDTVDVGGMVHAVPDCPMH